MPVRFKMIVKQNSLVTPHQIKYFPCVLFNNEIDLDDFSRNNIFVFLLCSKYDCNGLAKLLEMIKQRQYCKDTS